jgi:hypothetical protein
MRGLKSLLVVLITGVCLAAPPVAAQPVEPSAQDPRNLFFEALDLKEAGDFEGAIARFQLALSGDPSLAQAMLHVAECFYEIGMYEEAIAESERYLEAGFEMAEVNRATELVIRCRWALNNQPDGNGEVVEAADGPVTAEGAGETARVETGATEATGVVDVEPPAQAAYWAPVALEAGAAVDHFANSAGLTTVGPLIGVRVLPLRRIEVTGRVQLGLGGYEEGTVRVPGFGVGVGGSLPFGRVRVSFGGQMPMVLSGYGGESRIDVGIGGEFGVRVALGEGRVVLGAQLGGGYLVRPFFGGGVRVGVQLGELR